MSTTIALTPFLRSSGTSALAVLTSSLNSSPATPAWVTMVGVSFRVMPMKPTLAPWPKFLIQYDGRMVEPALASVAPAGDPALAVADFA